MIVKANLYPVARGTESKTGKKPVTFINSFYGKRDSSGLFMETSAVDCWLPSDVADTFKIDSRVDSVIDINGDFVGIKEMLIGGKRYIVDEKKVAQLVDDSLKESGGGKK